MAYTKYSLTPANNNAAPPDGAPEGMLPSAVNDTMRDMMAQIRDVGDGIRGGTYTMTAPVITGGSITGVALSGNTLTNPVITGGSISGTTFTSGTITSTSLSGITISSGAITGGTITGVTATGNTFTNPVITGGSINNTPIGASTANTGAFTTLSATGATTLSGTTVVSGSLTANTFSSSGATITGGSINSTAIGGSAAAAGAFTTLSASGVATFSAGTVSAPAITTTGDTNTGIYFPAADTIAFTEGGVEAMRIDSSGNISTNVGGYWQLQPSATAAAPTYSFNGDTDSGMFRPAGVANTVAFSTTGAERMRISSTGGLSIGTTADAGAGNILIAASKKLFGNDISGSFFSSIELYNTSTGNINLIAGYSAANITFATGGTTERMRITSTGNVGIGTSSPSYTLDVAGTVSLGNTTTSGVATQNFIRTGGSVTGNTTNGLTFKPTTNASTDQYVRFETGSGVFVGAYGVVGDNLRIATRTDATAVAISQAGNLGLGVTPSAWTSTYKALQIGSTSSLYDISSTTVVGNNTFFSGANLYLTTAAASRYLQTAGTHRWDIAPSGTAGNTITFTQAMTLNASGQLLVGKTTNTIGSTINANGTISETVSSTEYLVASQFDVGTAPNKIPLNQYLGALAYVNEINPALDVGTGITGGTGTICKVNGGVEGGVYSVKILIDLTGLNSGGTAGDIIGVNGTANPCYIARLPAMTVLGGRMTCLETPAGGDTDIDLYSATEGTGVEDQAITALTETEIINAGAQTRGTVTYFSADPAANSYFYLVGQGTANATYTAGRFLIEIFGVQ